MKAIDLYKFINDNVIEWHYVYNDGIEDVLIFPCFFRIEEFGKLLKSYDYDDGGIRCIMKDGYFAFWMRDLCEYYGIELREVFDRTEEPCLT